MKKLVVVGVAALAAAVSSAADVAFPTAGGDLSSAEAWGGSIPTDRALIDKPGDYTASDDVTLNGFYIDIGKNNDATFTVADGKTVTLNDSLNLYAEQGYNKITLKGGTWDLTSHAFLPQNGWQSNRRNNYALTLDGTTVANATDMAMGYYGNSGYNTLALTNGAALALSGKYQLAYAGKGNNLLHISSGSRMTVGGVFTFSETGTAPASMVIVEGEGSKLTTSAGSRLGNANGCQLIVRDGGAVSFGSSYWYMSHTNNTVLLDGAASSGFGPLYLTGSNNVFRLRNGSVATISQRVYVNSGLCLDSGFDIADSTFNFQAVFFDDRTTNFFIRVSGPTGQAKFTSEGMILERTRLIFDLPAEGYADGVVPMSSSVRFGGNSTVKLELDNLADLRSALKEAGLISRTYRIIQSTAKDLNGMSGAVSAANARYEGIATFKMVDTDVAKCIDVTVMAGDPTTLTVVSEKGSPSPAVGAHVIGYGSVVTAKVEATAYSGANGATRNHLLGWTGTGDVPASGTANEVSFVQTNDSSIAWNWGTSEQKLYFGGTLTWPKADEEKYEGCIENWIPNGDLSQSEVWSDPEQLAANRLRILAGGTYVIDRDVTLAGIDFSAKDEPVVLDATDRTVTMTGAINTHTKSVVTFKGGTYEMNGQQFMPENNWANNCRSDMKIVLDGTVVTNSSRFVLGYNGKTGYNTVCLTNGAVYHQTGVKDNNFWLCYAGAGSNFLHIAAGSRLVTSSSLAYAHSGSTYPSTIVVEGEGSCLKTGSGTGLDEAKGCRLIVRDGAFAYLSSWWNLGSETFVLVSNATVTSSLGSPYFHGSNATIRVCEAKVSMDQLYGTQGLSNAVNNVIDVIDGDVFIKTFQDPKDYKLEDNTGDQIALRLSGTHPKIQVGQDGGGGTTELRPRGKLVFDLPLAGYDIDEATGEPIVPLNLQAYGVVDATVGIEIENLDAIKADMEATGQVRRSWKILRVRNISGLNTMLNTANAKYAEQGVKFRQITNTQFIKATVSLPSGMMLIVR